ncbi:MAG: type I glyceraldehyde-3-phosphate dehydrogenase [Lachnospiraceae bacterium]|nr:type I glyceraldehyde-3-phosphate dehydrogenase [Lachnospiraceae bacterium]
MAIKIGINGFGRIGRVALRVLEERGCDNYEICGINLRNADLDYMVYQARYDTIFHTFRGGIDRDDQHLILNGRKIRVFSESDPSKIRWDACGAEYILETTGAFNTTEAAMAHMQNGAKKVALSAPAKDHTTPTFVMGVNHQTYTPDMMVVSNASCTTNCLAPMTKVINDNFGIEQGLMSTIHAATAKQKAVDSRAGRDWRTGRSVLGNIIPSSTGAAKAVGEVLPELKGKLTGMSFRVPTNDVSVVDLTVQLKRPATYEDICRAMREAARGDMRGIIICTRDQIVSTDLTGFSETCIFDETAGVMLNESFVKLIAWYDNEWGYTNKLIDLVTHMYKVDNEG